MKGCDGSGGRKRSRDQGHRGHLWSWKPPEPKTLSQRQVHSGSHADKQKGALHLQQSELGRLHPFPICPPHQLLRANMGNWVFAERPSLQILPDLLWAGSFPCSLCNLAWSLSFLICKARLCGLALAQGCWTDKPCTNVSLPGALFPAASTV